jgi:hypothetical protein
MSFSLRRNLWQLRIRQPFTRTVEIEVVSIVSIGVPRDSAELVVAASADASELPDRALANPGFAIVSFATIAKVRFQARIAT